jgi:branched-chain amino acid transport system substrate-binding protein
MRKLMTLVLGFAAAALAAVSAQAQGNVKIGLIMAYSGQFSDTAAQMDNAIKLYIKQHGDTVAGKKIELIRKDTGGPSPDIAKRLAQELVVRDHVDIIAGFTLTPEAFGAADVSASGKKLMVVMNAATSAITTKSPYIVRTSLTIPQLQTAFGDWAYKSGIRKVYTMVAGYGPGIDAEVAFIKGFKDAGGTVLGSVRMPVANPDFSAFVQRAKDLKPEGIFVFIPGGAQPGAFGKALSERGIDPQKTKVMGQMEITDEHAVKAMGDTAIGIMTSANYDYNLKSKRNEAFVKAYHKAYGRNPDFFSVGAWDGMHVIYAALKKTKGNTDAAALIKAAEGMKWQSPRGPMMIDPKTRDVVQTVYVRKVEKKNGNLVNVEIAKIPNVKDPLHK